MGRQSNSEIIDLNSLATRFEGEFRNWVMVEPLGTVPQFIFARTGPDTGRPRFGVMQEAGNHIVDIDPTYTDVVAGIILREIIAAFFPPSCLVDVVYDAINRFCGSFLENPARLPVEYFIPKRWQEIVYNHTRRYIVHYMGKPIIIEYQFPGGPAEYEAIFHVQLAKFRQFAGLIPPDQVQDIFATMITPVWISGWTHHYAPEDVGFAILLSDYMANHPAYPTPARLAGEKPGWSPKKCKDISRRFEADPISPTYMPNPRTLGLVHCWLLIETAPTVSNYIVRQLTYLPFATLSFSQCVGTPVPTYLNIYLLPPSQLDEFGAFLASLKKDGVILDFQIFRGEKFIDLLNFRNILNLPEATSAPLPSSPISSISLVNFDYQKDVPLITTKTVQWQHSWLVQQMLPLFGIRKYVPRAMTSLDPSRNYIGFLALLEDAALFSTANIEKDFAIILPLLEKFRNVQYVLRLLDQATDLFRFLIDHPDYADHNSSGFGKLNVMWEYFPSRDWLLEHFSGCVGDASKQADFLAQLRIAARILSFFACYTIPPGVPVISYLREGQQALIAIIKEDLSKVPADGAKRLRYFTELHDSVVRDRLVVPHIPFSPLYQPDTEYFHLFSRTNRAWEEISTDFAAKIAPHVQDCLLLQFRDQGGAPIVGGVIRATHAQFQTIRRALFGPKSILGPEASALVGRRVPYWDSFRRNYTETFNMTPQKYASIKEYLSLLPLELLRRWVTPGKRMLPYTRKILSDPYLGPVAQTPRPPPNVVKLTSKIITDIKESFLSGISKLHHLVERRLGVRRSCDLNWPAYGLERYLLQVHLSTRQPKYIYTHLITPETRRVLVSAAVSGFQTVFLEYLWPTGAPDDKFLQYLYSRTEKNVLAYSVHRILSDTRFFNLDKVGGQEDIGKLDAIDLHILMLAHQNNPAKHHSNEYTYGGDIKHTPGSAGWEVALKSFSGSGPLESLPPDSRPLFEFDPRTAGFSEKVALVFRGQFDALPLCQSLPFGHYYRTEEIYYSSTERLVEQPGHIILFDFPALQMSQLNAFLDDLLRDPAVTAHSASSFLLEQNLSFVQGVAFARINPLRANPFDVIGGHYIHLPKRQMQEGKWHTLSLLEQMELLNKAWMHSPSTKHE